MGQLDGKVIIVTGAGAGLGRAIVHKLIAESARVLAVDMNGDTVQETALAAPQGTCVPHTANVTSESSWHGILKAAIDHFGQVDTLVNCAGVVHVAAPSHEVSEEDFDKCFQVNVRPLYLSNKVMVPYWLERGNGGNVINLSSSSEPRPRPNLVWYASSKGAVTVATKGLASEYAKNNIRYNCIRPGPVETAMFARVQGGKDTPEGRKKLLESIPLGRACKVEDVANMACFLASDAATFVTGAAFDVDGGRGVS